MGHSFGDDSGDAGEMPSATTTTLEGFYTHNHRAIGEPSDGEAVHATKRPAAHLTADNDAAARQSVLAKGYELADYRGGNQGICAEADNTEEGEEEEGDEIEIKMEEDADEKGRSKHGCGREDLRAW